MSRLKSALSLAGKIATQPTQTLRSLFVLYDVPEGECSCCGFKGRFRPFGALPGVHCPSCRSLPRQRLLALALQDGFVDFAGKRILHFAPEPSVVRLVESQSPADYIRADLNAAKAARVLNIEGIDLPDASLDVVIASHILEHVDDRKALAEIYRVLAPGGKLVAMVPIVEGWSQTYEDPTKTTESERTIHFAQYDHVRYYGADFRDRIREAGFRLDEYTAGGAESVRYRLQRGEKVFLGTKPS